MDPKFHFICLSRDPSQRRMIERILLREGKVRWIVLRPLSVRYYKEGRVVAERALTSSGQCTSGKFVRAIRLFHLQLQYAGARRFFERHNSAVAVAWGALDGGRYAFMEGARAADVPTLFLEHAPIPNRLTVDPVGVNAKSSLPRQLAPYLKWAADHVIDRKGWYAGKNDIQQRVASRSRMSSRNVPPLEESFRFVP